LGLKRPRRAAARSAKKECFIKERGGLVVVLILIEMRPVSLAEFYPEYLEEGEEERQQDVGKDIGENYTGIKVVGDEDFCQDNE
jgi:hypothetical protein